MQPAVHALVLVAQSQAGMWRRNGYSLQNQVSQCLQLNVARIYCQLIGVVHA